MATLNTVGESALLFYSIFFVVYNSEEYRFFVVVLHYHAYTHFVINCSFTTIIAEILLKFKQLIFHQFGKEPSFPVTLLSEVD